MNSVISVFERLGMIERIVETESRLDEPENTEKRNETEKKSAHNKEDDIKVTKLLHVQEIYRKAGLVNQPTSTVFIIDSFAKALPESLPTSVKRQSVLNLISTSGMDIQNILKDGKKRLQELTIFLQNYSSKTDEDIAKNEYEIKVLTAKINNYKKQINDIKKLKLEQKALIEYETQKIQNIMEFIEGDE